MAHDMRWLLGVSAALVGTSLLVSQVDLNLPVPGFRGSGIGAEYRLARELQRANTRLREAVYVDSLLPLLPAGPGVRVLLGSFVDSAVAANIHEAVARQLAEMPEARARGGVFVVHLALGSHPGLVQNVGPRYTYFAGAEHDSPFCFVVVAAITTTEPKNRLAHFRGLRIWRDEVTEPLGPCYYWTRYGAPGARVHQWLRAGAYRFAETRAEAPVLRDHLENARPPRGLFGTRDWSGDRSLLGNACLVGKIDACARGFMAPDDEIFAQPRNALSVYNRGDWRPPVFGAAERALLADIERAFGPDRFAHFWRSEESADTAFARVFGVPAGQWLGQWIHTKYPDERPLRASLDAWTVLLSLMALIALFAAALVEAHRRQVR